MVNSHNTGVFWLCAVLALAISLGTVGLVIVYDAATINPDAAGRLSLRPGGGLLAILISASLLAIAFRIRWLATPLPLATMVTGVALALLPAMAGAEPARLFAINYQLLIVTGLMAASVLAAAHLRHSRLVTLPAAALCFTAGLLSLLSTWYPALETFSLGSIVESTGFVSPLVILTSLTLPFLNRVYQLDAEVSYKGLIAVGAVGILITTVSWHILRIQHNNYLLDQANTLADQIESSTVSAYSTKMSLIQRLAQRWESLQSVPGGAIWQQEVSSYLRDFPELQLISVLDPKHRPVITEARSIEDRFWFHHFLREAEYAEWMTHVAESGDPHLGRPLVAATNNHALAGIAVPFVPTAGSTWFVLAIVDLTYLYQDLTRHIDTNLGIHITAYGQPLFSSVSTDNPLVLLSRHIDTHHDNQWRLQISIPRGKLLPGELYLPPLALFSGLGLSFLVMLSHLLWRESEKRSGSLEQVNSALNFHLAQERALRYTNERILEFSRDILCSISREGVFLRISPACEGILGYRPEELQGQHYDILLTQEDRAATEEEVRNLLLGEQEMSSGFRTRLRHRDGQIVTVSWTAEWSREDNALFCVGRDITNELMAETLTRERDQFFSLSPDMFCIVDLNSYFFEMNNTFVDTLGYSREALLGTSYMGLVHEEDRPLVTAAVQSLTEGHDVTELLIRVLDASGTEHWLNINAILSADDLIYVVARDTTEQRLIEQKLRENEALLKMAERVAMIGGWVVDVSTGKSIWSDAVCAIHDMPPGHAPDVEEAINFYLPEYREVITQAVQTCIDTGIPFDEELQIRTVKGRQRWVRAIGHAVKGQDGKIAKLQGAFQDITASRQAIEQIRRYAERQATIFESITDAFFTLDREWNLTYVNRRSEELLQKSRDELLGNNVWDMFPAAVGTEFETNYRYAMATGNSVSFEAHYAPLDLWLDISAYPSDEGLAVYYRSINERKQAQAQLDATMAELERSNRELQDFAFVASHDLQEPLRKIQAFSDRLITRSDKFDEQEKDYLKRMQSAAGRMQNLIEDLLTFSRVTTQAKSMKVCDTGAILGEVLQDMETSISREQARIHAGELPTTWGDATQLRQVLQNLLSNAIKFHAPDRPPEIRVTAEDITKEHWTLAVSDNGIGFDERYAEKLFHPFQRLHQKEGYPGTGIGMAIVKKILDRHGATVTVNSTPGEGTTFRIRLRQS
ncbi:PAS domain S-box protein [Marinobacter sp. SS5-14b]|uniref:PAS domain S-box protein n=1 Tax=Marinobacter sp. SS5-14b TaxID=3050456 RepID=UPI0026DFD6B3|nr:PAS domain S-box protein [Marinobacter sp. SS5-14b]